MILLHYLLCALLLYSPTAAYGQMDGDCGKSASAALTVGNKAEQREAELARVREMASEIIQERANISALIAGKRSRRMQMMLRASW